jgi:Cu/Zn superoxide dismutase
MIGIVLGAAIVVDASPDNYRTNPSGHSSSHIVWGVFRFD